METVIDPARVKTKTFLEQDFTLDQLGNWTTFKDRDTDTGSTWDLDQDRDHNDANEIDNDNNHANTPNGITTTTGTNWIDPKHDAAGNMTTMPQPKSLASSYTGIYDAWNRLVEIKDGSTVAEYEYDGLNRRILRDETGGGGDKVHFYYNMQWQVLEERKEVGGTEDPDPLSQYVYHTSYVDAIVLRDYDANTDGTSVRHYYLQDANHNVIALTEDDGTVIERYQYSPYGVTTILDPDFSADADNKSDIANEYLYTGRRLDPKTGLQLNRNRYYHTELGRFINRDPVGYEDGVNLYAYVGNDPLNGLDPSGLANKPDIDLILHFLKKRDN